MDFLPSAPFEISAGAFADISHGVLPTIACRSFSHLFLAVVSKIRFGDLSETFLIDFPEISLRNLPGIPTGSHSRVPFFFVFVFVNLNLIASSPHPGIFYAYFEILFIKASEVLARISQFFFCVPPRVTYQSFCNKNIGKDRREISRRTPEALLYWK